MAEQTNDVVAVSSAPAVNHDVLVLRVVYQIFTKYSWIVIIAVGLFGNVMSIVITLQKDNRRISTCNYMTALAIADSGVLVVELVLGIFLHIWDTNPPTEFDMQLMWYLAYVFAIASGFYLAEMTVDRLVVVRFPISAPVHCTTRRALITIVVTFVVISGLNLYIMYTYKYVKDEDTGQGILRMTVEDAPELESLGNSAQLAIGTILPFVIIVFCNLWISIVLHRASQGREKMGVSKEGQKTREKETTYLTRMLLLVSIAYVMTSIPFRMYDVIIGIPVVQAIYAENMKTDEYWSLRYYCQHFVMLNIWEMNFGINFYLYCIGGGRKYRTDVKARLRNMFFCFKAK